MSEGVLRILLVEDNPSDADLLQETLAQVEERLEITHVERLQQAAEYLKQGEQADVILLDLGLPDSMGIDTLERANGVAPHLPIIVLTGLEDETLGTEAIRKGAQDYLVKGQTKPPMLLRAIHHAIERKQMAEALLGSEARFRNVFDHAATGIAITDYAGRFVRCNAAYCDLTGYTQAELCAIDFPSLIHPEDREHNQGFIRRLFDGAIPSFEIENRYVHKDASVVWVHKHVSLLRDDRGQATHIIALVTDTTERKRTEDVFRFLGQCGASGLGDGFFKELARYLAQAIGMDFVCIDRLEEDLLSAETLAVFHNGQFEDNVSYALKDTPCGEVVGQRICHFPRNVRGLFPKDAVLQDLQAESYIGTTLWNSQGKPIGLIAVIGRKPLENSRRAESIMQVVAVRAASELERQQAEKALRQSKEDWERTFNSVTDLIAILDDQHRIVRVNRAMAMKLDVEPDRCVGLPCFECVHGLQRPVDGCPHTCTIADGFEHTAEVHEERLGGHFLVTTTPMFDEAGRLTGAVHMARDITDRKLHEERILRLSQLYAVLSQVNEAIVRSRDAETLYAEVCRIVVETGRFAVAWIGQVRGQQVVPLVSSGPGAGYTEEIRVEVDGTLGCGPTGTCIRENRAVINNDFSVNPATSPWREQALRYGLLASAAFPLRRQGKPIGALTLYASDPNAFDADQVGLLESLSADLSYALDAIDLEQRRIQVEQALKESEARYRNLFITMSEGFAMHELIYDAEGKPYDYRFLEVNPGFEQATGLKADGILGRTFREVWPEIEPVWLDRYSRVAISGEPDHFEEYHQLTGRWYEVYASRTGLRQFAVALLNVTDRKHAEEQTRLLSEVTAQLLASDQPQRIVESLCRRVMDHLDCHVFFNFLVDEQEHRLRLNACAGIPEEASRQLEWLDYGTAVCGCAARDGCRIVAEHIQTTSDPHADLVRSFGIQAYACHPLMIQGETIGTLSFGSRLKPTFADDELALMKMVTDHVAIAMQRIRLLESLERHARTAEAANEAKSQFLANMSHELRTPMNAILGMIDVALPKATDPTVQDCLQTARGSADILLTLLNDLLDSARIESGKLELESAPFSLRRTLDQVMGILAVRASEKGLCCACIVLDGTPDAVLGDRMRLQQVLLNLGGNAIKFTEHGRVELMVRTLSQNGGACLEFAVQDSGIGIPPSVQDRLFQPFTQADASMARRFGGSGLGLSICKGLVEMMGGRIWVKSELGKGSTFYFTVQMPLARELPEDGEVPVAVAAAAHVPLRILLAEDNPANQKLAGYILQDRGHLVEIAGNGREAIYLAEQNRYDVILMDVQMPVMDGLEATAMIRKREDGDRRVPIIAMTAHAMRGDRDRCLAAGMDGYIAKPISRQELIGLVERLAAKAEKEDRRRRDATEPPSSAAETVADVPANTFDLQEALKSCFSSPMFWEMVEFFFTESVELMNQMHAALKDGNAEAVGRAAHRLRGTILYLGANPAMEAALQVEQAGISGDLTAVAEALGSLDTQIQLLKQALPPHRQGKQS